METVITSKNGGTNCSATVETTEPCDVDCVAAYGAPSACVCDADGEVHAPGTLHGDTCAGSITQAVDISVVGYVEPRNGGRTCAEVYPTISNSVTCGDQPCVFRWLPWTDCRDDLPTAGDSPSGFQRSRTYQKLVDAQGDQPPCEHEDGHVEVENCIMPQPCEYEYSDCDSCVLTPDTGDDSQ